MPKPVKHIWPQVIDICNLLSAWHKASAEKRETGEVLKFYRNLERNLFTIRRALERKTWQPSFCREFVIFEPKRRLIQAPEFADRVVHHALMNVVEPIFERRFIPDTYACRKGLGVHMASRRAQQFMREASHRWGQPYIIKADVSKFFPSVDQRILLKRVERVIGDPNVLWLFDTIIRSGGPAYGKGVPIGALTSQWMANLYLDPLDHFIKDELGVRCYVRYMDDFFIAGPSRLWCRTVLEQAEKFLRCVLLLKLNPKTSIFPVSHGLDFVGYRTWTDHVLPRKRTIRRNKKKFKRMQQRYAEGEIDLDYIRPRVASFVGYMQHCDGFVTLERILEKFTLTRKHQPNEPTP